MSLEISFKFNIRRKLENIMISAHSSFLIKVTYIVAVFRESGITPCDREKIIIVVKIGNKVSMHSFKTRAGIGSKDQDFLLTQLTV